MDKIDRSNPHKTKIGVAFVDWFNSHHYKIQLRGELYDAVADAFEAGAKYTRKQLTTGTMPKVNRPFICHYCGHGLAYLNAPCVNPQCPDCFKDSDLPSA